MGRSWLVGVASVVVIGCGDAPAPARDAQSCQVEQLYAQRENRNVDLLLVVDESPAMAPYQESLALNLEQLGRVLQAIEGGLPEVHIAVVSADPARAGGFLGAGTCGLHAGSTFLSDVGNDAGDERVRNYDGELGEALACIGTLGAAGGPVATPLASMRAALEATSGFDRVNTMLAVVVLAAQDDCSGTPGAGDPYACAVRNVRCAGVAPGALGSYEDCEAASGDGVDPVAAYADFLLGREPDPNLAVVGIASAPSEPFVVGAGPALATSCSTGIVGALPAVRLEVFGAAIRRSAGTPLCGSDWTEVLVPFFEFLSRPTPVPCLGRVATRDLSPDRPGLQLECIVSHVQQPETDVESEAPLPRCAMIDDATPDPASERPCWYVVADDASCPMESSTGLLLQVLSEPGSQLPSGTYLRSRCVCAG